MGRPIKCDAPRDPHDEGLCDVLKTFFKDSRAQTTGICKLHGEKVGFCTDAIIPPSKHLEYESQPPPARDNGEEDLRSTGQARMVAETSGYSFMPLNLAEDWRAYYVAKGFSVKEGAYHGRSGEIQQYGDLRLAIVAIRDPPSSRRKK